MQKTPLLQPSTFGAGVTSREPKKKIEQVLTIWSKTEDEEHLHQALLLVGDDKAQCKQQLRDMDADFYGKTDEVINYLYDFYESRMGDAISFDYGRTIKIHNSELDQTEYPIYIPHEFYSYFFEFTGINRNEAGKGIRFTHVPIEGAPTIKRKQAKWSP